MLVDIAFRGAHLITGPAGSGKTSQLCGRALELARGGEEGVLFLVGSRRTARSLQDRILRELGRPTAAVRVQTWHAFALSLLKTHYRTLGYTDPPGLLTGPDQFSLVRELLGGEVERERWGELRRHTALAGFVQELREFVLRAQDALESPDRLEERAQLARRPELAEAARFFRRYLDVIDARSLVDHANAIAQSCALLENHPEVAAAVRLETKHLLVDDYQDATIAQERLLRLLFTEGGSLVVAANPGAGVFGWRGGSAAPLQRFDAVFVGARGEALEGNMRGAPAADAWLFDHLTEEADAVARECRRLRGREGIGWGDIAIVVRRYGAASRAVRRALEATRIPYVVVGENRPLANEPALKPMLDLVRAALRQWDTEEHLPGLLASPVGGLDPYEVRALRREARIQGSSLADVVAAPPEDLPQDMRVALRTLQARIDRVRDLERDGARPDEIFFALWEDLEYFRDMVARGDQEDLDAVAAFGHAIARFTDRRAHATMEEYLDALEGVEFGPEPWNMPADRRPDAVRLMTAHHAVGTEFEAVIVAGCVEGEFPDPRDVRAMLDIRDLLEPATPFDREAAKLGEERRLFDVATSRARRRLLITAARESSQREPLVPSPLIAHLGLSWERREARDEPLTRDDAEAWARRTLRDPGSSPRRVDEALDLLAKLPGVDPDAWWFERDWTESASPIAPEDLRTSYSRLSAYDNCALQYLYQVELGLDTEKSHAMTVGSWVHDIVDKAGRGEIPQTVEALIEALDAVWDPSIFDNEAIAHRRRLDCEEMLKRWLAKDGELDTLASEVAFEFPIDGATMRGRIDRVVRLGNSMVRLIDYKTGKNGKSMAEAKEDLQLASYYLALTRVPELAKLGTPKYLELAYLGSFTRDGGFWRAGFDPSSRDGFDREAQERLEGFVAGIRAEEFAPSPSADCQWCRFKTLCPVWPEGDEVPL